jgi:hypothetical protein
MSAFQPHEKPMATNTPIRIGLALSNLHENLGSFLPTIRSKSLASIQNGRAMAPSDLFAPKRRHHQILRSFRKETFGLPNGRATLYDPRAKSLAGEGGQSPTAELADTTKHIHRPTSELVRPLFHATS